MAFVFRLEKVKRHRQRLVDEQGRSVAAANQEVNAVNIRLAAVEADLRRHLDVVAPETSDKMSVPDLMARTRWIDHLRESRRQIAADLAEARAALDREQGLLHLRWRDVEILKKLQQQQKSAWQANLLRLENKALDEVGQIRADRQRRSKIAT